MTRLGDMRFWGALPMGSVSTTPPSGGRSNAELREDDEIAKEADLLVRQRGADADIYAARRADALFHVGNEAEASRWLKIFRKIATSRLVSVEKSTPSDPDKA